MYQCIKNKFFNMADILTELYDKYNVLSDAKEKVAEVSLHNLSFKTFLIAFPCSSPPSMSSA